MSIEKMYGYFPGGTYDPRKFKPDREVNTPAEIEAWERLCAAWDAGCASVTFRCGLQSDGAFRCGSALGMGTYEVEVPDASPGGGDGVDLMWEERPVPGTGRTLQIYRGSKPARRSA